MVFNDLQDPRFAKAPKRLSNWVLFATLRYVESVANRIFHVFWNARSALVLPIQATGLTLSDAINFILCLNEHKTQRISSVLRCGKNPENRVKPCSYSTSALLSRTGGEGGI